MVPNILLPEEMKGGPSLGAPGGLLPPGLRNWSFPSPALPHFTDAVSTQVNISQTLHACPPLVTFRISGDANWSTDLILLAGLRRFQRLS